MNLNETRTSYSKTESKEKLKKINVVSSKHEESPKLEISSTNYGHETQNPYCRTLHLEKCTQKYVLVQTCNKYDSHALYRTF